MNYKGLEVTDIIYLEVGQFYEGGGLDLLMSITNVGHLTVGDISLLHKCVLYVCSLICLQGAYASLVLMHIPFGIVSYLCHLNLVRYLYGLGALLSGLGAQGWGD